MALPDLATIEHDAGSVFDGGEVRKGHGSILMGAARRNVKLKDSTRRERFMAVKLRRKAAVADIGGVKLGGDHPIVVQSMTNTDTADVAATVNQVMALSRAGSELVRVTVNTEAAAAAVPKIEI